MRNTTVKIDTLSGRSFRFEDSVSPNAGSTAYTQLRNDEDVHSVFDDGGLKEVYIPFHSIAAARVTYAESDAPTDDICEGGGSGDCTCSNLYFFYNGGKEPIKCNEEMTITSGTTYRITNSTTPNNSSDGEDSVAMNATVSNPTSFSVTAGKSGNAPEIQIIGATDEAQDGDTATVTLTVPSADCQFVINVTYSGESPK